MTTYEKAGSGLVLFLIIIAAVYFFNRNRNSEVLIVPDTNVIVRYEKELKRDTVSGIPEKIIYMKAKPDKIYVQRVDTVFINRIRSFDLPVRIEKKNGNMNIKALNIKDSVLKEYVFRDIGRDFTLNSLNRKLILKSGNFYYDKPEFLFSVNYPVTDKSTHPEYTIGMESGLSFREKLLLTLHIVYTSEQEKIKFGLSLKYKPF